MILRRRVQPGRSAGLVDSIFPGKAAGQNGGKSVLPGAPIKISVAPFIFLDLSKFKFSWYEILCQ